MKRRAARVIVFLLLGAIVNVAVAWGFFVWHPAAVAFEQLDRVHSDSIWHRWEAPFPRSYRETSIERIEYNSFYYAAHAKDSEGMGVFEIVELGAGWPSYCVVGQLWDSGRVEWVFDATRLSRTQRRMLNEDSSGWEFLPAYPIWPGFAINTVFYAAVLWMMFAFPFVLRRRRRIKRGLCPACAYPVGASPVCTECGGKLASRTCMGLPPPATPAVEIECNT